MSCCTPPRLPGGREPIDRFCYLGIDHYRASPDVRFGKWRPGVHKLPAAAHGPHDCPITSRMWVGKVAVIQTLRIITIIQNVKPIAGGWGGIRTLETLARLPVFKTGAFNHSATHPQGFLRQQIGNCNRIATGAA